MPASFSFDFRGKNVEKIEIKFGGVDESQEKTQQAQQLLRLIDMIAKPVEKTESAPGKRKIVL